MKRNFDKWVSWAESVELPASELVRNPESVAARAAGRAERDEARVFEFCLDMWGVSGAALLLVLGKLSKTLKDPQKTTASNLLDSFVEKIPACDLQCIVAANPDLSTTLPPEFKAANDGIIHVSDRLIFIQRLMQQYPSFGDEVARRVREETSSAGDSWFLFPNLK